MKKQKIDKNAGYYQILLKKGDIKMKNGTRNEKVVFDIGFFGDGSMELLKCMDKLFVPQPAMRSQQCKCKSWEALLKKEGLEECLAKMQYVAVNRGRI